MVGVPAHAGSLEPARGLALAAALMLKSLPMSVRPEVRAQLEALRIPTEQRPRSGVTAPTNVRPRRKGLRAMAYLTLFTVAGGMLYWVVGRGSLGAVRDKLNSVVEQASPAAEVKLMTVSPRVEPGPEPVLTATGKIVSDHTVSVSTKVSGQVLKLHFEQGDRVAAGQLLAEVEDVNYLAQRDHARAMLEKARADLDYQKWNRDRVVKMHHESGVATDVELAQMKKSVEETQAQLAASEAQLVFAQKALSDCRVVAPIAGTVLERSVEVGDFVAAEGGRGMIANAVFARIADMSMLRVEVDVSELDITRLRKDLPCRITPDAYKDRVYKGHVMWLDPGANYSKATVQAKVRIDAPDEYLRVEGSAKVVFYKGDPDTGRGGQSVALWIPKTAYVAGADAKSGKVLVASGGRLKSTPVRIGAIGDGQVEVTTGLNSGDTIVIEGLDKLTDGQRVKAP